MARKVEWKVNPPKFWWRLVLTVGALAALAVRSPEKLKESWTRIQALTDEVLTAQTGWDWPTLVLAGLVGYWWLSYFWRRRWSQGWHEARERRSFPWAYLRGLVVKTVKVIICWGVALGLSALTAWVWSFVSEKHKPTPITMPAPAGTVYVEKYPIGYRFWSDNTLFHVITDRGEKLEVKTPDFNRWFFDTDRVALDRAAGTLVYYPASSVFGCLLVTLATVVMMIGVGTGIIGGWQILRTPIPRPRPTPEPTEEPKPESPVVRGASQVE